MKKIIISALVGVVLLGSLLFLKKELYIPQNIWNIAVFQVPCDEDIFSADFSSPDTIFSPRKWFRDKYHYCTGYADPFLFVKDEYLYLFYENEVFDGNGFLEAKRTKDLKDWEDLGTVLQEPFHLSYPNVFEYDGGFYMLPEMCQTKTVTLYKADNFPYAWKPVKVLLDGLKFVDSDLIEKDGNWYLFTTVEHPDKPYGLKLYTSIAFDGEYAEHPCSPLDSCISLINWRNGGPILEWNQKLYRPAQKAVNYYGEDLGIWEITDLNPEKYGEKLIKWMHSPRSGWDLMGGHHFCSTVFNGQRILVMDGLEKDSWINNYSRRIWWKANEIYHHIVD